MISGLDTKSIKAFLMCESKFLVIFIHLVNNENVATQNFRLLERKWKNEIFDWNEETYKNVQDNGTLIRQRLITSHLDSIIEVRGMGLMIGIEIKGNSSDIQKKAIEKGLLVLTAGPNVIRLLPPIVITKEDANKACDILIKLLS